MSLLLLTCGFLIFCGHFLNFIGGFLKRFLNENPESIA